MHLAHLSKERPEDILGLMRGFLIANTVQFPRTFLIVRTGESGFGDGLRLAFGSDADRGNRDGAGRWMDGETGFRTRRRIRRP